MNSLMDKRIILKLVHFASTSWFIISAAYLLASALRQAGKSWWVIVSLSGYSTSIVFLLTSLYLFAIFRGIARNQKTETEHPLTASTYYMVLYDISPFLGAVAGSFAAIGSSKVANYLLMTAAGSLWATFLVWIIIDPLAAFIETLLPSSSRYRQRRLARLDAVKKTGCSAKLRLLAEIEAKEQQQKILWGKVLQPYAEELAVLASTNKTPDKHAENKAVKIGVNAWQIGGITCMRYLHSAAMEICKKKYQNAASFDYVSIWWDGIGNWRNYWLEGEVN